VVRVYAPARPGPDFEPAEAGLEDVYFCTLAGHVGRAATGRTPTHDGVAPALAIG
jgi:hypothetical protein